MGRLRHNDKERKYQIEELQVIHREILRMLLNGMKPKDIANELDVTSVMVSYVKNSHLSQEHLSRLEERADDEAVKVRRRIKKIAPIAYELLESVISKDGEFADTPIGMRIKVAQDLLDRGGLKAPQEIVADIEVSAGAKDDWVAALLQAANDTDKDTDKDKDKDEETSPDWDSQDIEHFRGVVEESTVDKVDVE